MKAKLLKRRVLAKQVELLYHNTQSKYLDAIKAEGLDAGSFSDRPIRAFGDVWLAVRPEDLPQCDTHQYGGATAYEPRWEYRDEDGNLQRNSVPADKIFVVTHRGKILGKLSGWPFEGSTLKS